MASLTRRARKAERAAEVAAAEVEAAAIPSLIAAAVNVRVTAGYQNIRWGGTDWQQEGWLHYDTCPEFHFGVDLGANNLSRARLIGVDVDPVSGELGTQPSSDPDVQIIMGQLFGGPTGQSQALGDLYRHLEVAGDLWALSTPDVDVDGATWEILATTEVTSVGGRAMVEQMNGYPREIDQSRELLFRIWRKHPKRRWEADAATRALLPVLRELAALTAMVSATVKSRLASAGILWIPEEITLPAPKTKATSSTSQTKKQSAGAEGWLDLITEAMTAPIRDPDSAAAVVPLVSVVKAQYIEKIAHMKFGSDLDAMIAPLREDCTKRLAIGMNLPPSLLTGIQDANHWTAWTITEDYARAYLAPRLELIADAITVMYLRPALRAFGRDPNAYAVHFDLDKLLPRQISTDNAQKAYDAGAISEAVYVEALGFPTSAIPDDAERVKRLVIGLIQQGNAVTLTEIAGIVNVLFPSLTIQIPEKPTIVPAPVGGTPPEDAATTPRELPPSPTSTPSTSPSSGMVGA